ncbi:hypothetical protein [Leifsonia sp. Leaf264]|uniref:hypothetical protein n=1 Tax=Leifsonia sp. Leaf264 TaxID=1736314 RepID=UPI000A8424FF|nr:hypothetical protein [Leifsonia sp. Leaf264]
MSATTDLISWLREPELAKLPRNLTVDQLMRFAADALDAAAAPEPASGRHALHESVDEWVLAHADADVNHDLTRQELHARVGEWAEAHSQPVGRSIRFPEQHLPSDVLAGIRSDLRIGL